MERSWGNGTFMGVSWGDRDAGKMRKKGSGEFRARSIHIHICRSRKLTGSDDMAMAGELGVWVSWVSWLKVVEGAVGTEC
jgi:hypothetical protein